MTHDYTMLLLQPREAAMARAQQQANAKREAFGVWEHVGQYGLPAGDLAARHTFTTRPFSKPDPADDWALVACVDPELS
jgi:hypothetical protein